MMKVSEKNAFIILLQDFLEPLYLSENNES